MAMAKRQTFDRAGEFVRFAITDTGIGIVPEHLFRIFERFYHVESSRSRVGGGSGIALALARHLVEAQYGEITAVSEGLGEGIPSASAYLSPEASRPYARCQPTHFP